MTNSISINQINAQVKIQEIWKAINIKNYSLSVKKHSVIDSMTATRSCTSGKLIKSCKSLLTQKTCKNDVVKIWNNLPKYVQTCTTLNELKTQSRIFVKTLPV